MLAPADGVAVDHGQGEIAFIACAILFAVTAIGLATAWWLQHKKYLKSKAQLRERNERKAKGKTFDPSKVRADQDPAVVKSRYALPLSQS